MKHIWWINHHAIPPVVPGGTRHYSLAKEIMKLGDYKVTVINGSFDHLTSHFEEGSEWGAHLESPTLRNYDGVDFYTLPTPYYKGSISISRIKNMLVFYKNAMHYLCPEKLQMNIAKPDLIIGSIVHPFAAYAGYKLSKLYNVPFVYEVRDLWPLVLVKIGKISRFNPLVVLFRYLDRVMANNAKLIITTSPLFKKYYIEEYHIEENKLIWITNGSILVNDSNPIESRKPNNSTLIKVGYTGSISLGYGIDLFLQRLRLIDKNVLNHFVFTFVGNGPEKSKFMEYCNRENLPVVFQNPVPKNKVAELLKQFDVLLAILISSPLSEYGISFNKLADYHAVGKPILMVGDVAQNPVDLADSGFLCKNIENLEATLKEIQNCSDENFWEKANNAQAYALKNYHWPTLAKRLLERLNPLME